jgi:hypothetical protein
MGTFLATPLLAAPIVIWIRGTFLLAAPQLRLARFSFAPRGIFPNSWKPNSSADAARPNSHPDAARWVR